MTKEHGFFVLFLFLPLLGLFLLGPLPALAETPVVPPETIILISLDTTRADHLSCYGYEQETTPNIDSLAKDSLFFEHPFAPAPMTQPAHGSMFTGTLPPTHGVHENLVSNLSPSVLTLAEILKQHDFTTYGIVSSMVLAGNRGFNQGFDHYDDAISKREADPGHIVSLFERDAEQTTDRATTRGPRIPGR